MHYQKFYFFNFLLRNKEGLIKEQLTYKADVYNYCFSGKVRTYALKMPFLQKKSQKSQFCNFFKNLYEVIHF